MGAPTSGPPASSTTRCAVDREVDRLPHADVVERAPPHVEEHPVRDRRRARCAAGPASCAAQRPEAIRRDVAGERVGEDREVGGAALDRRRSARSSRRAVADARPRCGPRSRRAERAPGRRGSAGCGRASRRASRPRRRRGRARCRAASDPSWRGRGCRRARRTRSGIVSLCRKSASRRVRWIVIVRAARDRSRSRATRSQRRLPGACTAGRRRCPRRSAGTAAAGAVARDLQEALHRGPEVRQAGRAVPSEKRSPRRSVKT